MLELAGAFTDGTILSWVGPRTIDEHIRPKLSAAAANAGRPDPRIIALFSVCVTDDEVGARAAVDRWFADHGEVPSYTGMLEREGVSGPADVAFIGDEASLDERIRELAAVGVTDFVAGEVSLSPHDAVRTREWLKSLNQPAVAR
jgi:alkanesulfonate monooxygenase SsuD/methylene tetrahydromethanopterin reductase-like flavin-dependent oxidoreductase (luciferase family)